MAKWHNVYIVLFWLLLIMGTETTRPTPISKDLYIKFGNKCRTNNQGISIVLEKLVNLYLKDGEKIFST